MSKIIRLSNFQTASRCWLPTNNIIRSNNIRLLSSNQRYINLNQHSLSDINLISNDEILNYQELNNTTNTIIKNDEEMNFEPTIFSNDDVFTAGPVNKH
ncbi:hypothetical protein CLIB1444_05S07426 [[Candida] jaroonii]|uniref:Uncharacterized protein n=1 Tax=[Candida] jaroonii TaxID=467808 RepID=A0ACA9Y956_9ASCO|nr:hypothetical protein CLIB1444_05S07426 [[Candida] jaroonii]